MKLQNLKVPLTLFAALVLAQAGASSALAQSNSDGFETVINSPPDSFSFGNNTIGSNTQVNVLDGVVFSSFTIGAADGTDTNIELNVFDGAVVGGTLFANTGSVVNVLGGNVGAENTGGDLRASGGTINISDGSQIFHRLNASDGGEINISGGTVFRLNLIGDATVNVTGGTVTSDRSSSSVNAVLNVSEGELLGTFSFFNGTVNLTGGRGQVFFARAANIFGGVVSDAIFASEGRIAGGRQQSVGFTSDVVLSGGEFLLNGEPVTGTVTLGSLNSFYNPFFREESPDVLTGTFADGTPFVFSSVNDSLENVTLETVTLPSNDTSPLNIGPGEVSTGGRTGQTLTVQPGGLIDESFSAVDTILNVRGGTVADGLKLARSVLTVEAGSVVGAGTSSYGSDVNVSGGQVGPNLEVFSGTLRLSGGRIGRGLTIDPEATATIVGGEFRLNGVPITEPDVSLGANDALEGTLADGTPFVFSSSAGDRLETVTLEQVSLPDASTTPIIVDESTVNIPLGLRPGQTLTVEDGGQLGDDFTAFDTTFNVRGGQVSQTTEIYRSTVNVSGGQFGAITSFIDSLSEVPILVRDNSTLNVLAGEVGVVEIDSGSIANVTGGSTGRFVIGSGGEVNIEGGRTGTIQLFDDTVLNIFGGSFGQLFLSSADDSSVNFTGTEFFLDGDLIDDLEVGETRLLDASLTLFTLSGVLSDGSEFSSPINRRFTDNLQISITRVDSISEPVLLGDVDLNGSVNFSDISPFILVLVSGAFQAEADCDENGVVNFLDISPFIAILSSL